jgi:hypothetical protein
LSVAHSHALSLDRASKTERAQISEALRRLRELIDAPRVEPGSEAAS